METFDMGHQWEAREQSEEHFLQNMSMDLLKGTTLGAIAELANPAFKRMESHLPVTSRLKQALQEDETGEVRRHFLKLSESIQSLTERTFNPLSLERYLTAAKILNSAGIPCNISEEEAFDLIKLNKICIQKAPIDERTEL